MTNQKPDLSPELRALIECGTAPGYLPRARQELDAEDRVTFKPPKVGGLSPVEAAAVVRKWLGLKEQNTFATYRAAVECGACSCSWRSDTSARGDCPKSRPWRVSRSSTRCPVILVKKSRGDARQVFTLMHELGHVLLHQKSFIDEEQDLYATNGREREANLFAGHLLVPDSFLQTVRGEDNATSPDEIDPWLESCAEVGRQCRRDPDPSGRSRPA